MQRQDNLLLFICNDLFITRELKVKKESKRIIELGLPFTFFRLVAVMLWMINKREINCVSMWVRGFCYSYRVRSHSDLTMTHKSKCLSLPSQQPNHLSITKRYKMVLFLVITDSIFDAMPFSPPLFLPFYYIFCSFSRHTFLFDLFVISFTFSTFSPSFHDLYWQVCMLLQRTAGV